MKISVLCFFSFLVLNLNAVTAQPAAFKAKLTNATVVKDSSGKVYAPNTWTELISSGKADITAIDPSNENSEFLLKVLSEEEYQERIESMPAPPPSKYFTTGKEIASFSAKDINGEKYQLKSLRGKVVVLNFWYIACYPCQLEMPELNKLVAEYKDSSDIVFLAIGLDEKSMIKKFLERKPFDYSIIDDGRFISNIYGVAGYPTNLVVDKQGKVTFHTSGYGMNTIPWLRKSIVKARKGS